MSEQETQGHVFKLDRNRRLRFTQRSKFRMSNSGLTEEQLQQGTRSFANLCAMILALIDEPNPNITPEDIAVAIEGREQQAQEVVIDCLVDGGVISKDGEPDEESAAPDDVADPKSHGPETSPSHESTSG